MANFSALDERSITGWDTFARRPAARAHAAGLLAFALTAAPVCWLAQVVLGRTAGTRPCASAAFLPIAPDLLYAGDAAALLGTFAGGLVAFAIWRQLRICGSIEAHDSVAASRKRLLAMWALMMSVWLFGAIVFNALGSAAVHACTG